MSLKSSAILICTFLSSVSYSGDFQGSVSGFASAMPQQKSNTANNQSQGFETQLSLKHNFTKKTNLKIQTWTKSDFGEHDKYNAHQAEIQEFSLEQRLPKQKIKLGISTLNWESTDGLNPMDGLNVKNFTDPLNIQNRGNAGFFYTFEEENFTADFAYIPQQLDPRLPGRSSPWLPRKIKIPTLDNNTTLLLPNDPNYDVHNYIKINNPDRNNYAIRFKYKFDIAEVSIAGFEAMATPQLQPIINVTPIQVSPNEIYQLNSPIRVQPLLYKNRIAAASVNIPFTSWLLKFAGQYSQPMTDDSRIPSWSSYGILGIEKNISWGDDFITLILQATSSKQAKSNTISTLITALEKSYMLGMRFPVSEKTTLGGFLFQEEKYKSNYFKIILKQALNENFNLQLIGDVFTGSDESILGLYRDNSQGKILAQYNF